MSEEKKGQLLRSLIESDMQDSYLRYSMSVIVSRALPDARDGFKPVHRRVLYSMHKLGVVPSKPTVKSARIVGDVIGKYHPHGDSAVYETLVRMAQDFSLRYPLVFGQGNFGSVDGDGAAAMRYTEAKMNNVGMLMLEDLEKDTVDMSPNYDESLEEPSVLPAALPNMLVNGSTGIAVGMATSMAPHNLKEISAAIEAVAHNPEIPDEELLEIVSGPDFPTGGVICGISGIRDAYLTGRGRVVLRARTEINADSKGKQRIIITEIPYMVNKAELCKKIGELVREKRIDGITDVRDETNREGIRIVIELRRDAVAEVVLNNLFKDTQLQTTFSICNLALVNGLPKVLTLKELVQVYIDHRLSVISRAAKFDLGKAESRLHIINGLLIATKQVDEVVGIIKNSDTAELAKAGLSEKFGVDGVQAQAIVDMRLSQLTGLNVDKLNTEHDELTATANGLREILSSRDKQVEIMLSKLAEIVSRFGDERRSTIEADVADYDYEDLIAETDQVITLSRSGYIKRMAIDTFKQQNRGGKGVTGASLKEDDDIDTIITASTHSYLLVFTDKGRAYWTKVYRLPEGNRGSKGRPIVNFIEISADEHVQAIVPIREFIGETSLVFCTRNGTVNRMQVDLFSNPRKGGINAISLDENDSLIGVILTNGDSRLMIATRNGQAATFDAGEIRSMGRGTHGVRGIDMSEDDSAIAIIEVLPETPIVTLTENGYGKRAMPDMYRVTHRGGKGVRNLNFNSLDKTGKAVFVGSVPDDYDMIVTSQKGQVIRIGSDTVRQAGRSSVGVKVISLDDGDLLQDAVALKEASDSTVD